MIIKTEKKKGISPLIAVVLLVAFTLAIGAFLSTWARNLAKQQAETVTQQANRNCAYATLNIDSVTYYPLKKEIVIKVRSTGTQAVTIGDVEIFNSTYFEKTYTPDDFVYQISTLQPGDSAYIVINNVINNITEVRIVPKYCPENAVSITSDEFSIVD